MRQALEQGRLADAEAILERLRKEDPLSLETRGLELEFCLSSNRLAEAQALSEQLCRLYPESSRVFYLAGKLAYKQKRYGEAEASFRESQRLYPSSRSRHWLGKALTQGGRLEEAEALLQSVAEENQLALLDLAWLYERKNDLEMALQTYDRFLQRHPSHPYALEQRTRLRASRLEPESLIREVQALADFGEQPPDVVFPEYIRKLLETGQAQRARREIEERLEGAAPKLGVRLAWICHKFQAYDLSYMLFMRFVESNLADFKYLNALEADAARCGCLAQLLERYRKLASRVPALHGRCRNVYRRLKETP
jgi:tetratricopeptide (TPR) repeat protein